MAEATETLSFGTADWIRASTGLDLTAHMPEGQSTISAALPWETESETQITKNGTSRVAPRSPRTSKRDQIAPLPSPESADTD